MNITDRALPRLPKRPPAPGPAPDLVVADVVASKPFPYSGDSVYFDVLVKNVGTSASGPFDVDLSAEGMLKRVRSQGLAAGAQAAFRTLGPLQVPYGAQLIWVEANVDTFYEVRESDETNNRLLTSLSVQNPYPPPGYPHT